ncbi:MAG: hypothetical protein O3C22_00045 [Bacteroidetes bacterium]|nr:hypothetical protein [Bacteroidota bacterium]MDA0943061.1 hypothetical protein [Bacteroidota bacterium]MDA1112436.1 hypothetical protein [Bacteroidota bacterium]
MKANAVLVLLLFLGACQSPERIDSDKPYTVAMTYVADCPLSVKSSGVWLDLARNLPSDSFDRWLFVGECDRPLSAAMRASVDRMLGSLDSARSLGFTHYPMLQIWKGKPSSGRLLYRGPLDNSARATGQTRVKADSLFVHDFLTRLRKGENPTFESHTVYGCYIEP